MKKLQFFAAGLALVFAVCSAFTNASNVKSGDTLYGVTQVNANTYSVEDITGQTENEDFLCNQSPSQPCTISADPSNVINGEVQKSDASPQKQGEFQKL